MDESDFADMVEHTPVTGYIIEYREPSEDGVRPGKLVGACLTDKQNDGLSMIYSFYEPDHEFRSGLWVITSSSITSTRAADMGLNYVYLGYWVEGSARMQYKVRYRPLERLGRDGWERMSGAEQEAQIAVAAQTGRSQSAEGGGKDGTPGTQKQYKIA